MSRPLALALLLAIAAGSGGCEERRSGEPTATAEQRSESPPDAAKRDCPVEGAEPAKGSVCIARRGPNWTYAFVYPPEAARIPALDSWLRSQSEEYLRTERDENDADGLGSLARYGKEYAKENPEGRLFHEKVYSVDADLPALLALTKETSEYSGGAHGWFGFETLIWDKTRSRVLKPEALFSDPSAANAEIRRQLCPALIELRRRRNSEFNGRCEEPPYDTMTLLAAGGRVARLKVTFSELDGYAGGTYSVDVPVTPRLLGLVAERFRAGFALSISPPRACNNEDDCVEGRSPGLQPD
jgi:hypothetical protein